MTQGTKRTHEEHLFTDLDTEDIKLRVRQLQMMQRQGVALSAYERQALGLFQAELQYREEHRTIQPTTRKHEHRRNKKEHAVHW